MIITISGLPGCGKTTVSKLLSEKLSLKYISAGEIFREMAKSRGMTIAEFGEYAKAHPEVDNEIDKKQLARAQESGGAVMEGRLSGWLAKANNLKAMKVWLNAGLKVRAERIVKREKVHIDKATKELKVREDCERSRYESIYNVNMSNSQMYDVIIDANRKTPEEICTLIIGEFKSFQSLENKKKPECN